MDRKTVLVTGGCGYLGRHVVEEFLSRGHRVIVSDVVNAGVDPRAEFIDTPIFDCTADLYDRLGCPDVIVHMAWRDGFIHNSTAHMEDLPKHVAFINRMIDSGVPSLSIMGSMHEVGYWEGAIEAETPCNPQSQYGISKNALRQSTLLYAKGKKTSVKWLRAYYIYGDDSRGSSIFAKIIRSAAEGKKVFPFTTGKNQYDFIHIDDLAHQVVAASIQNDFDGIINICSGKPETLAHQVEKFIQDRHLNIRLEYGAYPDRPYDSPGVWGDARIIQQILEHEKDECK